VLVLGNPNAIVLDPHPDHSVTRRLVGYPSDVRPGEMPGPRGGAAAEEGRLQS
jgi:hypothetical protein